MACGKFKFHFKEFSANFFSKYFIYLFIFGLTCSLQKFLTQESKPLSHHGSNLSHSSSNTRLLTH